MKRREFLRRVSGLFVAMAPALILPKALRAQGGMGPGPGTVHSTSGSLGLRTNLTGFWSFENTSWTDDTGNGTTLTPTASPTSVTGKVGNAVSVNGSTQYLSAASNTNIVNGGSSFSVQAWINSSVNSGVEVIFNKNSNTFGNKEWGLGTRFTSSNVWSFKVYNTGSSSFDGDSTVTITTGSWVHLVGTYNSSGNAIKIYVNGTDATSGSPTLTGTAQSSAGSLGIGSLAGSTFFNGLIDQCGFWKGRVLSASDVTALYNSGSGLTYAAMA